MIRDDHFLLFNKFWAKNWSCADLIALKEPVLLLRSENVVTLLPGVKRYGYLLQVFVCFKTAFRRKNTVALQLKDNSPFVKK